MTSTDKELFAFDADGIAMPRAIRQHPVVGFGRRGDPNGDRKGDSPFTAFFWIASLPNIAWVGTLDAPYLSVVRDAGTLRSNPARVWCWTMPFAKKFVRDLYASGLIDYTVRDYLFECMPEGARARRGSIPSSKRSLVLAKTSGKCAYCAIALTTSPGLPNSYEPDHVLAVNAGGSDDIANLIPSCRSCNGSKSDKTALKFLGGRTHEA